MFTYVTPEQAGISSDAVLKFIKTLDKYKMCTHDFIMARGNQIFAEGYYAPFHKDYKHRMYSITKSFVSVAIGLCEEEGLLSLDDKLLKFFPEYRNELTNECLEALSIRDMLKMCTANTSHADWFLHAGNDRVATYFMKPANRVSGTTWRYDSQGSFMMGVIVEKLTGKPLVEYLKDKFLRKAGFCEDSYCLKAPGGYSWGDSGMMCTAMDLLKFARFVTDCGTIDGVRYMNEAYLREATDKQASNDHGGAIAFDNLGYGYQIWRSFDNTFFFYGMGGQYAICNREKDFICVINSDNQGSEHASRIITFHELHHAIMDCLGEPLPENPVAYQKLQDYISQLKLYSLDESLESTYAEKINGKTYQLAENPMGIEYIHFEINGKEGVLTYKNAQGIKKLPFGFGHNVFCKFPQEGYPDMTGGIPEEGHMYDCAVSADWPVEYMLRLKVQIIDKYFGVLDMEFGFKDDKVGIYMQKIAEDFLEEYMGDARGWKLQKFRKDCELHNESNLHLASFGI